jgi:hypothetical protein
MRSTMAGLYDGLEEAQFKPIAGGYVFQTNNPWFFGPPRRYLVNEAQKVEIAACLRKAMRRIIPLVCVAALLIPLVIVAANFWMMSGGATTPTVTLTTVGPDTTITATLPLGPTGAKFTLPGTGGSIVPRMAAPTGESTTMTAVEVNGPPGAGSTAIFTIVDQTGKATLYRQAFALDGARFTFKTANSSIVFTVIGRTHPSLGSMIFYSMLLALAMFVPYLAAIHVYRARKLKPLIAGLLPSDERISVGFDAIAGRMSTKLLAVLLVAGIAGVIGFGIGVIHIVGAILEHSPVRASDVVATVSAGLMAAAFAFPIITWARVKRRTR